MANRDITSLPELTTAVAEDDLLAIDDISEGTNTRTKRVTVRNLVAGFLTRMTITDIILGAFIRFTGDQLRIERRKPAGTADGNITRTFMRFRRLSDNINWTEFPDDSQRNTNNERGTGMRIWSTTSTEGANAVQGFEIFDATLEERRMRFGRNETLYNSPGSGSRHTFQINQQNVLQIFTDGNILFPDVVPSTGLQTYDSNLDRTYRLRFTGDANAYFASTSHTFNISSRRHAASREALLLNANENNHQAQTQHRFTVTPVSGSALNVLILRKNILDFKATEQFRFFTVTEQGAETEIADLRQTSVVFHPFVGFGDSVNFATDKGIFANSSTNFSHQRLKFETSNTLYWGAQHQFRGNGITTGVEPDFQIGSHVQSKRIAGTTALFGTARNVQISTGLNNGNHNATEFWLGAPTSSKRYKKKIKKLSAKHYKKVLQMEPVEFVYKHDAGNRKYGFIAEDVFKLDRIFVHMKASDIKPNGEVVRLKEEIPDGVDYEKIVVPLVAVIKEHEQDISVLKQKISELQASKTKPTRTL